MINVVACACAKRETLPSSPLNLLRTYEQYLNLLNDVIKQLVIAFDSLLAEDSTFVIKARNLIVLWARIQQGFILIQ